MHAPSVQGLARHTETTILSFADVQIVTAVCHCASAYEPFREVIVEALSRGDYVKEGVLEPDVHDPTLNPLYRDMLAHSGAVALPCRVRHPDRKGKIESGVGHAQRTPLRGMRFETLAAAQQYLDDWETRWADTRIHGTTKRQVAAMFAEEQPHLQPLPLEPFRRLADYDAGRSDPLSLTRCITMWFAVCI